MNKLFNGSDLIIIEHLGYDPALTPAYDLIKNCLVWEDERPMGLTPLAYENLCDLWIARSFIHRGLDFSTYKAAPTYFADVWQQALNEGFKWPGFQRLELNQTDMDYYLKMIAERESF
jgi:hypothetical protein